MALAFLVNIPFLFNNLIYFISERFFPKTVRFGALSWDREKWQKIVRLTAKPWELAGLLPVVYLINTNSVWKWIYISHKLCILGDMWRAAILIC